MSFIAVQMSYGPSHNEHMNKVVNTNEILNMKKIVNGVLHINVLVQLQQQ